LGDNQAIDYLMFDMSKRIAIISSTFPPYRGGIGKVAEMDAEQLTAAGFSVTVLTPGTGKQDDSRLPYKVRRLKPLFRYGNASVCPQLRNIWNEFDLVILHYPFYGGAKPLILGKPQSGGAKLALVYHMDTFGKGLIKVIFGFHWRFCAPKIMKRADVIIGTTSD
jgi:glycosyltransferase involved in cell wall biosynthesis